MMRFVVEMVFEGGLDEEWRCTFVVARAERVAAASDMLPVMMSWALHSKDLVVTSRV